MAKRKKAPGHIWPHDILKAGFTTVPHDLPAALASRGLSASAVLVIHGLLRRAYRGPLVYPGFDDIAVETGLSLSTVKRQMTLIRDSGVVIVTTRGKNRSNEYDLTPLVEGVREYRAKRADYAAVKETEPPEDASLDEAGGDAVAAPESSEASGSAGASGQVQPPPEAGAAAPVTAVPRRACFGKPFYAWEKVNLSVPEEVQKLLAAEEAEAAKPPDPERVRRTHEVAAFRHAVHMKLGGYARPVNHSSLVKGILALQQRRIAGME